MHMKIVSVGIELEGSFSDSVFTDRDLSFMDEVTDFYVELAKKYKIRDSYVSQDGSVAIYEKNIRLVPLELKGYVKLEKGGLSNLENFVREIFKKGFIQNESCGNHIHLGWNVPPSAVHTRFKRYERFLKFKEAYQKYIRDNYLSIRYELRMNNQYCSMDNTIRDRNIQGGTRYCGMNIESLNVHKTIEIRLLPYVFTADEYIRNLRWLIATMNRIAKEPVVIASSLSSWYETTKKELEEEKRYEEAEAREEGRGLSALFG